MENLYNYEKMSREDLIALLRANDSRIQTLELEIQKQNLIQNVLDLNFPIQEIAISLSEGIIIQNHEGKIIFSNPSAEKILKLTKEQLFGRASDDPYWKIVDKDGNLLTHEEHPSFKSIQTGVEIRDSVLGLTKKDGTITWINVNTYPIKNKKSKKIDAVVSSFFDITDQIQTNKELSKYKDFMENALKATEMGIWSWNILTDDLDWSPELYKFLDLDVSMFKISRDRYFAIIHPEDTEHVNRNIQKALMSETGDYHVKHRILNKRNEIVWIEARGKVTKDQNNIPIRMEGTAINITEKINSEIALKSQSFLLNETGRIAKVGGWEIDVDTNEIFWTSETYNIFEIKENEYVNIDMFLEAFDKDDQPIIKRKIDMATFENLKWDEEFEIDAGKMKKWVRVIGVPQKEFSRVNKILGTIQDITEKKYTEQSLKQSEQRFQTFYDLASEGICIFSKEYKVLDINPAFCYLLDFEAGSIIGSDLEQYFSTESFLTLKTSLSRGETFGDQLFVEAVKKTGQRIPTQCRYRMIYYNNEFVYIASFLDITFYQEAESLRKMNAEISMQNELIYKQKLELERAISHLQETQEKLIVSEKLASLGQLIAGIAHEINNPVGAINASNKNNEDILISMQEYLPEVLKIFSEQRGLLDLFFELYNKYYDALESFSTMESRRKKRELSSLLENYNVEDPFTIADVMVDLGITELEERYIPIYKNTYLFQFLFWFISLHRNNQIIQVAHARTSKIIYALKNYSRVNHKGEKVLTDIKDNLDTVLTLYHNQLKMTIEVEKDFQDIPKIYCYSEDLLQVWTNLIYNALQAMQFQGKITIRTEKVDDMVVVSISDTGHGIPENLQKKIFDPFFTTKPAGEGSGLGLDIVKRIIEKHSGNIQVQSKPGLTTFSVWLPIDKT